MKASQQVPCVDCNEVFPRKELNRNGRCSGCAGKAVGENAAQLLAHEGPYYEKWKKSIQAAAERL